MKKSTSNVKCVYCGFVDHLTVCPSMLITKVDVCGNNIMLITYSIICCLLITYSPFYGYHDHAELFLKIYLVNPGLIKRYIYIYVRSCAELLYVYPKLIT